MVVVVVVVVVVVIVVVVVAYTICSTANNYGQTLRLPTYF